MFRPPFALSLAFLLAAVPVSWGQELTVQPTPFSVWLDFKAAGRPDLPKIPLPIWMESFQSIVSPAKDQTPEKTSFRIRLRRMGALSSELQFRLFFEDQAGSAPVITGWTEIGSKVYTSPALGQGLNLPASESVTIPVSDLDYLEIEAPGDGHSIRGAFLTTVTKSEVRHALDFQALTRIEDPFGNAPSSPTFPDDLYLFGRVRASIEAGPVKLTPVVGNRSILEFSLESRPLLAVIRFEVLNLDPLHPPTLIINEQPMGRVSVHVPDLADPAFQGEVTLLETDMRFHYTGWIKCELAIPGSALVSGANRLIVDLDNQSGPVAFRSVEIDLKHPTADPDYSHVP